MTLADASPFDPPGSSRSLLLVCDAVAGGSLWTPASLAAHETPAAWLDQSARRHGVVPPLPPAVQVDEETLAAWRQLARRVTARTMLARYQLRELGAAFDAAGVEAIALKGAAALTWLYEDPGCRQLRDLDLLVRPEQVESARGVLVALGYAALPTVSSPEEEAVRLTIAHLRPYARDGRLPVELHAVLPGLQADMGEVWRAAVPLGEPYGGLLRLAPEQFSLHAATHFMGDLAVGVARLSGVCDLLRLARDPADLSWERVWDTARRWGVTETVAPLLAALPEYWSQPVPGLPAGKWPIPLAALLGGGQEAGRPRRGAGDYLRQAALARMLPPGLPRLRYLFHLLFPVPERLRFHYGVPHPEPIAHYYLIHLVRTGRRVVGGLRGTIASRRADPRGFLPVGGDD